MEMWKANLLECIKEIERAREDNNLDQDKFDKLAEIIVELQDVIED